MLHNSIMKNGARGKILCILILIILLIVREGSCRGGRGGRGRSRSRSRGGYGGGGGGGGSKQAIGSVLLTLVWIFLGFATLIFLVCMCKICCCDNDDTPEAVTTNTTAAHAQPPNYSQGGNEVELIDTCMPHDYSRVDQNFCVQDDINHTGKSTHSNHRQDPPSYSEAILMGTHT